MTTLGIDYGRSKVGIALGQGSLSEPVKVIKNDDIRTLGGEIEKLVKSEGVDKVVIGISEGEMGKETKKFAEFIRYMIAPIPVDLFDETLTSQDAQRMSREAGVSRKKRKGMEDAYAASIMLQNYIDSKE